MIGSRNHLIASHCFLLGLLLCLPAKADIFSDFDVDEQCVVLLHGLARTERSMGAIADELAEAGYRVANIGYPSREYPIEVLAVDAVGRGVEQCADAGELHFVTHSLGGILVRQYVARYGLERLGRVVMLGPPNQGSEVVDAYRDLPGFGLWNGPAGAQLGTGADSFPRQLGPVDFKLGIIAGNWTNNPILSLILPDADDGKVTVKNTRLEGMSDHLVMPVTHTFMMRNDAVIEQVMHFLDYGWFDRDERLRAN